MGLVARLSSLSVCVFLVSSWTVVLSQVPEAKVSPGPVPIEVDPLSKRSTAIVPFDQPFTVKLEYPSKPDAVAYLTDSRRRTWQGMMVRQGTFSLHRLPKEHVVHKKESEKNMLSLRFDYSWDGTTLKERNDLIKPSRNVAILLLEFDTAAYGILERVHRNDLPAAKVKLTAAMSDRAVEQGAIFGLVSDTKLPTLYALVKDQYANIDTIQAKLDTHLGNLSIPANKPCLDELIKYLWTDTSGAAARCGADCPHIAQLVKLHGFDGSTLRLLICGYRTIDSDKLQFTIEDRIAALKGTLSTLAMGRHLVDRKEILIGACEGDILVIEEACSKTLKLLSSIGAARENIKQTMIDQPGDTFWKLSAVEATSNILEFKSRAAFRLIPEAGFVYYGFQEGFNGALPYLGVCMNFRQMNKNIPFSIYPNRRWDHYVSFSLGWTMNNIAKEGERKDLFTKGSLLTGLGIRLNHSFRIHAGGLWFYRSDKNPLVDNSRLTITPYVGLSLDLDLKQWLNGLDGLVPITP